jgi:O-antigen/teichoic acid export membrane protein
MMGRLFRNTVVTAMAFAISSVLGLIAVSIIVSAWGLAPLGLIVLARTFLPVGFMAILDFGVSEIATQAIARARANSDWQAASHKISLVLGLAILIGATVSIAIASASDALVTVFHVDAEYADAFRMILYATAAANFVLFPTLVAEGIVKGYEHFPLLRGVDVASNVIYFVATAIAAQLDAPFQVVAFAFLAGNLIRSMAIGTSALHLARGVKLTLGWGSDRELRRSTLHLSWLMAQSRFLGVLQGPLLPIVVGLLYAPVAVGVYDILVRLPRFAKSVLSILNASLLPVSAIIDEHGSRELMQRLGRVGLVILPAVTIPPLTAAAVFAEPILRLWLGPKFTAYWPWMSTMFAVPAAAQFLSFGSVIMLVRPNILAILNYLSLAQIIVMVLTIIATLGVFQERAFILGQAVSWLVLLPWQVLILARELEVGRVTAMKTMVVQSCLIVPLAVAVVMLQNRFRLENLVELAIAMGVWCAALWVVQYLLILDSRGREEVRRMVLFLFRDRRIARASELPS